MGMWVSFPEGRELLTIVPGGLTPCSLWGRTRAGRPRLFTREGKAHHTCRVPAQEAEPAPDSTKKLPRPTPGTS